MIDEENVKILKASVKQSNKRVKIVLVGYFGIVGIVLVLS